ncbi:MAG: hypothetical protein FWE83_08530 [Oscillospiraceae bacterium]|nr:hypothetical protein [Oscillospiraceae bacterium]
MKVLRNKSGASLMFVLATMMLLMVLGVSVIAAAGYNVGAGVVQHNRTQLELYSSSMERTIKAAFDVDAVQPVGESLIDAETFGRQILREAISGSGIFPAPSSTDSIILGLTRVVLDNTDHDPVNHTHITITMTPADNPDTLPAGVNVVYTITITGVLDVFVNPYERRRTESVFTGGIPAFQDIVHDATAMTMTITGDLEVELVTTFEPVGNLNQAMPVPYTFDSVTTYRLDQLVLEENLGSFVSTKADEPVLGDMLIDSPVVWTVIRYESFS